MLLCQERPVTDDVCYILTETLVQKRSSEVAGLCSGLTDLSEMVKTKLADIDMKQAKHTDSAQEWATNVKHFCTQNKVCCKALNIFTQS